MLQDARIESRVLMIEDPEARLLREIIFVFWKNDVVQSRSCSDIRSVNQCLGMRYSVLYLIEFPTLASFKSV